MPRSQIIYLLMLLFIMQSGVAQRENIYEVEQTSANEMWTNNNFRLILFFQDSTFQFTKNDEPMVDYISGRWIERRDSFFFFSADLNRILYFSLIKEDSIHRKVGHIDPEIFESYQEKFPSYFYLNKTYYENGNLHKQFDFLKDGNVSEAPNELKIQCFTKKGTIDYTLSISLKTNEATYIAYLQNEHVYAKELVYGKYKNGIQIGVWHFNEYDPSGAKLIHTSTINY
jgi:hypothetical protein